MEAVTSPILPRTRRPVSGARKRPFAQWGFAEWFILSQTFLPALLYLPGTQPLRIPIRMASYGISLGALGGICCPTKDGRRL